jgi:hypothetical protein
VPHHWKPHTLFAAAGPATNAAICFVCAIPLFVVGFLPNANPFSNPYSLEMKNYRDGRVYTSQYGLKMYKPQSAEAAELPPETAKHVVEAFGKKDFAEVDAVFGKLHDVQRAVAPTWVVWVGRVFWLSWLLMLLNLLPAYPLDGGQIMQGLVWAKSGHRQGVVVAGYSGFVVSLLVLVASISANESLLMGLALFMMFSAYTRLQTLDADDGGFGYDFSAGYTSLERDEPPTPRAKKQSFVKRWLHARNARRLQREVEERQREEERFDQLLEKVHKSGKASLTDEERRFMERVSARYRNRS